MEGAKGVCLAVLMADAGWHGKDTGLSVESRIPSQVLRDVPESMVHRMRPDMLLIEIHIDDNVLPTLHDLQHPQRRRTAGFMLLRGDFARRWHMLRNTKRNMHSYEQHRTLLDLLKNAGYADVQLHLLIFGSTGGIFNSQRCI